MKLSELNKSEKSVAEMSYFGTSDIKDGSFVQCTENCCDKKATQFTTLRIGLFEVHLVFCVKHAEQIWQSLYGLPGPDETPEAEAHLEVSGNTYLWILDECPYCLQRHTHGGGKVGVDDPYKQLGHRVAHCSDPFRGIVGKGYDLIEAQEETPSARELARTLVKRIENSDDSCKGIIADFIVEQTENCVSGRFLSAVMRQYQAMQKKIL
ncbi:MAG: hypothetical protein ISS77_08475 [Phycisphaerae bacterium]|nr:hypothetical protein [Phycisphaerae bacterium]